MSKLERIKEYIKFMWGQLEMWKRSQPEDGAQTYERRMMEGVIDQLQELKEDMERTALPPKLFDMMLETYDSFLKSKGLLGVNMEGRHKRRNSKAVADLIRIFTERSRELGKKGDSEEVLNAWQFMLKHWDLQSPFNRGRIELYDITSNLNERLNQIKNGWSSKTSQQSDQERHKLELAARRQARANQGSK